MKWQKKKKKINNFEDLKFRGEYFKGKIISGKGYDIYANLILNIKMKNERKFIIIVIYYLKENIKKGKDGMEKDMIMMEMKFLR